MTKPARPGRRHAEYALALVLDLVAAAAALLVGGRSWQTITTPLANRADVLQVSGRTVDPASTALALVALAGVVAVLATRGIARRLVGAVIGLAGGGLVWRASESFGAIGIGRARRLVADRHRTVGDAAAPPHIDVHVVWPVLVAVCGVLVLLAGLLITWRGHRWGAMSTRYENRSLAADAARARAEENPQKAAASLWTALDRGEDPTSR
ncbi:Trp biosynthesis-associated membrane protein [uncultured Jatrophihabitans sp.]|uniref:Trp biosynthesis-associated membrane protein n=1 Tax=uncultured Jatrophihabitans sp. TaxID=1610747 RepID=UPI0035CA75CA